MQPFSADIIPFARRGNEKTPRRLATSLLFSADQVLLDHRLFRGRTLDHFGRNSPTCLSSVGASTFAERAAPTTDDLHMKVSASPYLPERTQVTDKGTCHGRDTLGPYPRFRLNLEQQGKRAKELLKAARSGEPEALAHFRSQPKLAEAQYLIARELRFDNWAALKRHITEMTLAREAMN